MKHIIRILLLMYFGVLTKKCMHWTSRRVKQNCSDSEPLVCQEAHIHLGHFFSKCLDPKLSSLKINSAFVWNYINFSMDSVGIFIFLYFLFSSCKREEKPECFIGRLNIICPASSCGWKFNFWNLLCKTSL